MIYCLSLTGISFKDIKRDVFAERFVLRRAHPCSYYEDKTGEFSREKELNPFESYCDVEYDKDIYSITICSDGVKTYQDEKFKSINLVALFLLYGLLWLHLFKPLSYNIITNGIVYKIQEYRKFSFYSSTNFGTYYSYNEALAIIKQKQLQEKIENLKWKSVKPIKMEEGLEL